VRVQVVPELPAPEPRGRSGPTPSTPTPDPDGEPDRRIEIVLPDGTAVRVTEAISIAALRRVLAALRG
jgi:hypothetical protein